MIIRVEMDGTGCLTLTPVNGRLKEKFARHLRKVYSPASASWRAPPQRSSTEKAGEGA